MTVAKFRSFLYKLARVVGDLQAARKGRVVQRLKRRLLGKTAGLLLRKI